MIRVSAFLTVVIFLSICFGRITADPDDIFDAFRKHAKRITTKDGRVFLYMEEVNGVHLNM